MIINNIISLSLVVLLQNPEAILVNLILETNIMAYTDYIESNADIMLGKPVFKNTKITVSLILKKLSEGASPQHVITSYPNLSETSIDAVLTYASVSFPTKRYLLSHDLYSSELAGR